MDDFKKNIEGLFNNLVGPTKRHPDGKIGDDDHGEIRIAMTVKDNRAVIYFGAEVRWLALTKDQTAMLIKSLKDIYDDFD